MKVQLVRKAVVCSVVGTSYRFLKLQDMYIKDGNKGGGGGWTLQNCDMHETVCRGKFHVFLCYIFEVMGPLLIP